jgi:WD40 repeat protein
MKRNPRPNPYVGPRAFRSGETLYGRTHEIRRLSDLLVAERIVLLNSPSGAGKTSLIRAGLLPRMVERSFHIQPVMRVNSEPPGELPPGINRYILSVMLSLEEAVPADQQMSIDALVAMNLDDYLTHRLESDESGDTASQLLIFDQFEEILTIYPNDLEGKQVFFTQLGHALRNRRRWALFAMREDYVAGLDPYLRQVPTRLEVRFRLDLLGEEAARQAIQLPVAAAGAEFDVDAAQVLIDDLRRVQVQRPDGSLLVEKGPYVEPVQLQVVCYRLWEELEPDDDHITLEDLATTGDVDQSLAAYYADQVHDIAREEGVRERQVREWFDRRLITENGIRSQVLMGAERSEGLPNPVISRLENAHLVRRDTRRGITWFELAHDRLVYPVRRDNQDWFQTHLSLLQRQAALWNEQGRPEGILLHGSDLVDAKAWAAQNPDEMGAVDQEFLDASLAVYQEQERQRQQQAERLEIAQKYADSEKRRAEEQALAAKKLRTRLLMASLFLGLAVVAALVAFSFWTNANLLAQENARIALTAQLASTLAVQNEQTAIYSEATALAYSTVAAEGREAALEARATALFNAQVAEANAAEAERLARLARSGQLAAQSQVSLQVYPQRALLLALESARSTLSQGEPESALARQALYDALANIGGAVLKSHPNEIWTLAVSPDGRWLATGGRDCTVRLWRIATPMPPDPVLILGQVCREAGDTRYVSAVRFTPDGHWLAAADRAGWLHLFNLQAQPMPEGQSTWTHSYQQHQEEIDTLVASPAGGWLATGSRDDTIRLWPLLEDGVAGDPLLLAAHQGDVNALAFDSQGARLASASNDDSVRIWAIPPLESYHRGQLVESYEVGWHNGNVLTVAFSPDGLWLASGADDRSARLWRLTGDDDQSPALELLGHEGELRAVAFSPNGRWLVTAGMDKTARLWDLRSQNIPSSGLVLRGHDGGIVSLTFDPSGRWLATASTDFTAWLWDLNQRDPGATPRQMRGHEGTVRAVGFSPDGAAFFTASTDHSARAWDMRGPNLQIAPLLLTGHERDVRALAFSSDGRWLASGSRDSTARLWDLTSDDLPGSVRVARDPEDDILLLHFTPDGRHFATAGGSGIVWLWDTTSADLATGAVALTGHSARITDLVISTDGRWLASVERNGTLLVWSLATPGDPIQFQRLQAQPGIQTYLTISSDGRWLASGGEDFTVRVWDLAADDPARTETILEGHQDVVRAVAFSPDGRWLASAGSTEDRAVHLWAITDEGATGNGPELTGHQGAIQALAFSPDGRWLASSDSVPAARLWDLSAADVQASSIELRRHEFEIQTLAFTSDSRWLVTASVDGSVRLWDTASQNPAVNTVILRGINRVWALATSPDGHWLASGTQDGQVRLWPLSITDLSARACATTNRNLTRDEWEQFLGLPEYVKTCEQWP